MAFDAEKIADALLEEDEKTLPVRKGGESPLDDDLEVMGDEPAAEAPADVSEGEVAAAEEMLAAFQAGDAPGLAKALRNAVLLAMQPREEDLEDALPPDDEDDDFLGD